MCFRLKGSDKLNEKLLSNINASGKLHMVPANVNDKYVIRFCAVAQNATEDDIGNEIKKLKNFRCFIKKKTNIFVDYAWQVIVDFVEDLLENQEIEKEQVFLDVVRCNILWFALK